MKISTLNPRFEVTFMCTLKKFRSNINWHVAPLHHYSAYMDTFVVASSSATSPISRNHKSQSANVCAIKVDMCVGGVRVCVCVRCVRCCSRGVGIGTSYKYRQSSDRLQFIWGRVFFLSLFVRRPPHILNAIDRLFLCRVPCVRIFCRRQTTCQLVLKPAQHAIQFLLTLVARSASRQM